MKVLNPEKTLTPSTGELWGVNCGKLFQNINRVIALPHCISKTMIITAIGFRGNVSCRVTQVFCKVFGIHLHCVVQHAKRLQDYIIYQLCYWIAKVCYGSSPKRVCLVFAAVVVTMPPFGCFDYPWQLQSHAPSINSIGTSTQGTTSKHVFVLLWTTNLCCSDIHWEIYGIIYVLKVPTVSELTGGIWLFWYL